MHLRIVTAALAAAALALASFAYRPALDAEFHLDDFGLILWSPSMQWTELSFDGIAAVVSEPRSVRRPVAKLTLALNHLFGGVDPFGYHAVNVLIHLCVGAALAWVTWLLARGPGRAAAPPAVLAAGLFLVHPLNTQAVTYVVQRMTSLATLFSLLALGAYLTARTRAARPGRWLIASGALWLLGCGSKEIAFALPGVALAWEACFRREWWLAWLRARRPWRSPWLWSAAVALALLAVGAEVSVYHVTERLSWSTPFAGRDFSGYERVLTEARVVFFYVSLWLWPAPSRLSLEHDFAVSHGLFDPPLTALAVLGWLAFAVASLWLARVRPRWGFPLLAFGLLFAIEQGPLSLELVFEHRMYLPSAALAAGVGVALADLPDRVRTAGWLAAGLLALPLAGATYARNLVWSDPVTLYADAVEKAPDSARPHVNLGIMLGVVERYAEALPHFERALELEPDNARAHEKLATSLRALGRMQQAMGHYRRALEIEPEHPEALYNLATLLDDEGRRAQAAVLYRLFLKVSGPQLRDEVAYARARLGRIDPGP